LWSKWNSLKYMVLDHLFNMQWDKSVGVNVTKHINCKRKEPKCVIVCCEKKHKGYKEWKKKKMIKSARNDKINLPLLSLVVCGLHFITHQNFTQTMVEGNIWNCWIVLCDQLYAQCGCHFMLTTSWHHVWPFTLVLKNVRTQILM
jgi:hypothetical protein